MIRTVVVIDGARWTITGDDRPNPLCDTPGIHATVNGVTVAINYRYRQITSLAHTDGCRWGVHNPICTCAPRPADPQALFDAVLDVQRRCDDVIRAAVAARDAARDAAQRRRDAETGDNTIVRRLPRGCEGCPSALYGGVCTCC
jgi:hypothetical protein